MCREALTMASTSLSQSALKHSPCLEPDCRILGSYRPGLWRRFSPRGCSLILYDSKSYYNDYYYLFSEFNIVSDSCNFSQSGKPMVAQDTDPQGNDQDDGCIAQVGQHPKCKRPPRKQGLAVMFEPCRPAHQEEGLVVRGKKMNWAPRSDRTKRHKCLAGSLYTCLNSRILSSWMICLAENSSSVDT